MAAEAKPHPIDALFQPSALIALVLAGEGLALVLSLAPAIDEGLLVRFGLASLAVQWISLGTVCSLYLLRRPLARLPPSALAPVCLGVLLLMTLVVSTAALQVFEAAGIADSAAPMSLVARMLAMAFVVGLVGLVGYRNYWAARQLAIRAKQAELEALQARVHPHFLFNTLNSAAALVHARPDDAEQVLLDLGDLFRAALSEPGWVPLEHELDLCRRYLAIEQQRFGDRLRVEWRVDDGLTGLSVPLLTIQPLVENAVMHGLDERSGAKSLSVGATQTSSVLVVSVRNAAPERPVEPAHNGHNIGLAGVRARVESATHGAGSVVAATGGGSFEVRMTLPKAAMPARPSPRGQTTTR